MSKGKYKGFSEKELKRWNHFICFESYDDLGIIGPCHQKEYVKVLNYKIFLMQNEPETEMLPVRKFVKVIAEMEFDYRYVNRLLRSSNFFRLETDIHSPVLNFKVSKLDFYPIPLECKGGKGKIFWEGYGCIDIDIENGDKDK